MPYGEIRVDTITFTNGGLDTSISVSGLANSTTGNLTVTGTVSGSIANFVSGSFSSSLSGAVITATSGVIASGTAGNPSLSFIADANTGFWSPAADTVAFSNGGVESARIDSGGRVLIGATQTVAPFNSALQAVGTAADATILAQRYVDSSTGGSVLYLSKSRGTNSAPTVVLNGDILGTVDFRGYSAVGNTYLSAASISAFVDGEPDTGADPTDMPGRLVFSTSVDQSATPTERMRIDSAGNVGIRASASTIEGQLDITNVSGTGGLVVKRSTTIAAGPHIQLINSSTTAVFNHTGDLQIQNAAVGGTPTEKVRINSSGQVLIGTASAIGGFGVALNGAASTPGGIFSGTWFSGGTATTTKPQLLVEASGATSTGWSTNGTGLGVNAASGFTGRLLDLQLNGVSNFNIDSTGRLSFPLGLAGTPSLYPGTDTDTGIWSPVGNALAFSTGGTEQVRIDSAGRVLIGLNGSTPRGVGSGTASDLEVETAGLGISCIRNSADGTGAVFGLGKSRGTVPGSVTTVIDGDNLGEIRFVGADGATSSSTAATVRGVVDGTPGTSVMPGRLVFLTSPAGSAVPAEALRITNDRVFAYNQPAPAAVNATATLTIANLKAGIVTSTSAAATDMTLPSGTLSEAGFANMYTNMTFEWSVINTGPSLVRVLSPGADHTIVGSGSVATGTSARFASRRTASNTFVTYRLS